MKDLPGTQWKLDAYPMYASGKLSFWTDPEGWSRVQVLGYTTASEVRKARRDGYVRPKIRCYSNGLYYCDKSASPFDDRQQLDTFNLVPKDY